jgi:hypothetical protein
LEEKLGAPRVIESASELFISVLNQSVYLEIALVVTPQRIRADGLYLLQDAFAEAIKGHLPQLAEHPPIYLTRVCSHSFSLANGSGFSCNEQR